jgi:hypothetical protein
MSGSVAPKGRVEGLLAWWGGFLLGPVPALAVWSSSDDQLVRSHARAATVVWTAMLAAWIPLSAASVLFGVFPPARLLLVLAALLVPTVGLCVVGTVQLTRSRTLTGQAVGSAAGKVAGKTTEVGTGAMVEDQASKELCE